MKSASYSDYCASRFPWLGPIPSDWKTRRLKFVARTIMGQSPDSSEYSEDSAEMPFLQGNAEFGDRFPTPKWFCDVAPKKVPVGAILLSVRAPVGALNEADKAYGIGRGLCAIVENGTDLTKQFAWYVIQTCAVELHARATGSTYDAVSADDVGNMLLPLPTPKGQAKIAAFLDWKADQINALIARKQELLEKLKEKRLAVITQVVTKGLNPDSPMRDSGIPWLGYVPQHWEIMKLHHVARMKSGEAITSADIEEIGRYPVFGGNGIRGYTENFTHEGHFVLIGRQGAWCGNINYADGKFWASEHAVVAKPDRMLSTIWFGETLRVMDLNQYSQSAAQPGLSVEAIGRLKIPFPPYREQIEIARHVEQITEQIDKLSAITTKTIDRLTQYRTALINAATTGKIDVRSGKSRPPTSNAP